MLRSRIVVATLAAVGASGCNAILDNESATLGNIGGQAGTSAGGSSAGGTAGHGGSKGPQGGAGGASGGKGGAGPAAGGTGGAGGAAGGKGGAGGAAGGGAAGSGGSGGGGACATLYVSASTGSDTGHDGCTPGTALKSVHAALASATMPSATVTQIDVCVGDYVEPALSLGAPVSILGGLDCATFAKAATGATTIAPDGGGTPGVATLTLTGTTMPKTVKIEGLTLQGGSADGGATTAPGSVALAVSGSASPTIQGNVLLGGSGRTSTPTGIGSIGVTIAAAAAPTLTGNRIDGGTGSTSVAHQTGTVGVLVTTTAGLLQASGNAITGNTITSGSCDAANTCSSLGVFASHLATGGLDFIDNDIEGVTSGYGTGALFVAGASDVHVLGNRLYGGDASSAGGNLFALELAGATGAEVYDNLILSGNRGASNQTSAGIRVMPFTPSGGPTQTTVGADVRHNTILLAPHGVGLYVFDQTTDTPPAPAPASGIVFDDNVVGAVSDVSGVAAIKHASCPVPADYAEVRGNLLTNVGTLLAIGSTTGCTGLDGSVVKVPAFEATLQTFASGAVDSNLTRRASCAGADAQSPPEEGCLELPVGCSGAASCTFPAFMSLMDAYTSLTAATPGWGLGPTVDCAITRSAVDDTKIVPVDFAGQPRAGAPSMGALQATRTCRCSRVYVNGTSGSDGEDGCDPGKALKTLAQGISIPNATEVRVCAGSYTTNNFTIANGVSLRGGYACDTWTRKPAFGFPTFDPTNATTLTGSPSSTASLLVNGGPPPAGAHLQVIDGLTLLGNGASTVVTSVGLQIAGSAAPLVRDLQAIGGNTAPGSTPGIGSVGMRVTDLAAPIVVNDAIDGGNGTAKGAHGSVGLYASKSAIGSPSPVIVGNYIAGGAGSCVTGNGCTASAGMLIEASSLDVSGNYVTAYSPGGPHPALAGGAQCGIQLTNTSTGVRLLGNQIYGGDAWQPTATALQLGAPTNVLVANNVVYGGSQSAPAAATSVTAIKVFAPAAGLQIAHNTVFTGFGSSGKLATALVLSGFNASSPAGTTTVNDNVFVGTGNTASAGIYLSTCPAMLFSELYANTFVDVAWGAIPTGSSSFTGCPSFAAGFNGTTGLTTAPNIAGFDALVAPATSPAYPDQDASCPGDQPSCDFASWPMLTDAFTTFGTPSDWAPSTASANLCSFVSPYDDTALVAADFAGKKRTSKPTAGAFEVANACP